MRNRTIVLIDGSNFYFKMKDLQLHHLTTFNFTDFLNYLVESSHLISTTYYVGKIRANGTQKVQASFNQQRMLLAHLKKHAITYSLGYLLKSGGKYHEKGVDVHMAVDMLVATYENQADKIILISSDTDLLPAIQKAREKGKVVEYVGFSHQLSRTLVANCTSSRSLTKFELEKFVNSSIH